MRTIPWFLVAAIVAAGLACWMTTPSGPLPVLASPAPAAGPLAPMTPAPRWHDPDGDDVQISSPNPLNQSETIIAVNPIDRDHLIAGCIDERSGERNCAFYASFDGGLNWSELFYPIAAPYTFGADPMVAFGPNGETYFGVLVVEGAFVSSALYVGPSPDGGVTVPAWYEVARAVSPEYVDKGLMIADTGTGARSGTVYVLYTHKETSTTKVRCSSSTDGGQSWNNPRRVSGGTYGIGVVPAVASNGDLHVVWINGLKGGGILHDRSTDGGRSWGSDTPVINIPDCNVAGFNNTHCLPGLAMDDTGGPYDGNLYICYEEAGSIWLARSVDAGTTWTTGIPVSDDPGGKAQIYPAIDVDPNGNVNVGFYDRRDSNKDRKVGYYVARSSDGGLTFLPNVRVADEMFNPNKYADGCCMGDYNGLAASDRTVHPIWVDGRNDTNDVFTSRVELDFHSDLDQISAATGGAAQLTLNPGPNYQGADYRVLGTLSGTAPGVTFANGVELSLNIDSFTVLTWLSANGPNYPGFVGQLDGTGSATATLDTLGPLPAVAVGAVLDFATVVELQGQPAWTSNPTRITIAP